MHATKVRLRFAKRGDLRLISHHDLLRCLERALRRAALPVARTRGFTPRPKLVFSQALALGIEGRREVLELELAEPMEPDEVRRRLAAVLPAGFDLLEAEPAPPGRPAQPHAACYRLALPAERRDAARAALAELLASPDWIVTRRRGDRQTTFDLRPFVLDASIDADGVLRVRLKVEPSGSARPEELLEVLGLRDLLAAGCVLVRDDIELTPAPPAPQTDHSHAEHGKTDA
jgi:radical SAM-linked protein